MYKKKFASDLMAYIEEHLEERLSLDKLAKQMNYTKFHMNRVFAEVMGCTVYQYIKARRLAKAGEKLITTDLPILEIAFEAGYHSQQAFTQAFREEYGYAPKEYRRRGYQTRAIGIHVENRGLSGNCIIMSAAGRMAA